MISCRQIAYAHCVRIILRTTFISTSIMTPMANTTFLQHTSGSTVIGTVAFCLNLLTNLLTKVGKLENLLIRSMIILPRKTPSKVWLVNHRNHLIIFQHHCWLMACNVGGIDCAGKENLEPSPFRVV